MGKLDGRTAIVTGASRGLGHAIANSFVIEGADVVRPTREQLPYDLDTIGCEILINCAGEYGPIGAFETLSPGEWINTFFINFFVSAAMCRAVIPGMRSRGYGKIIQISGGGATQPMPNMSAYAASKAAVVRFAETLAEELRGTGIDVNSLAPGILNTRLLDQVIDAGAERAGADFHARMVRAKVSPQTNGNMQKAVDLAVFLASAESDGITGKLISAQWDKWQVPAIQQAMREKSDDWTLRRVTPETRVEQY